MSLRCRVLAVASAVVTLSSGSSTWAQAPATSAPTAPAPPAPLTTVPASAAPASEATPSALPAPASTPPEAEMPRRRRPARSVSWDLNLEGGLGHSFAEEGGFSGFGRVRGGVLLMDATDLGAPLFYSLGFFADGSNLATQVAYGVQGEVLSLMTGLWAQAGVGVDVAPRPVFLGSVGWSIVGVEVQGRWDPDAAAYAAMFGKIRIPIGVVALATR